MIAVPAFFLLLIAILFPRFTRFVLTLLFFGVLFAISSYVDHAHAADSADVVRGLGPVLAAEDACGLKYDQKAIAEFIGKNVDAADSNFTNVLTYMTDTTKSAIDKMTPSSKQVFCVQEARVAESYGFISSGVK